MEDSQSDRPDLNRSGQTMDGVKEALENFVSDSEEKTPLEKQWERAPIHPRPEDLGYEWQSLQFITNGQQRQLAAYCLQKDSLPSADQYVKVDQEAIIEDVTEYR